MPRGHGFPANVVDGTYSSSLGPPRGDEMASGHTQINLTEVADAAPANGFGGRWEARVARKDLDAEQTGLTHFRLRPGKRSPFMHRHRRAEEVYVILRGAGRVKLDDVIVDVRALDAVRVAPQVARAFEAGPEGLEFIAFGPHHEADGEPVEDAWVA
jgi:mannose-6-phosphate isomerase-like protein (cupin superfamily)